MSHCKSYLLFFLLWVPALIPDAYSQSSSRNQTALSGGVAYIDGNAAQFYNPANLMIQTHKRTFKVTMGSGSLHYSDGMEIDRFDQFPDHVQPYFRPGSLPPSAVVTESGLQQMFGISDRYHQSRSYDIIPFGVSWMGESSARSISFRSRGHSVFEMNRNWFETGTNQESFTRFINEKSHVFHEISFGLAREVTMFNRWQSGLNTLLIGLAPKAILGGMYSEANFHSEYIPVGGQWQNTKQLETRNSGAMDRFIAEMVQSGNVEQAFQNNLNSNSNMEINGYGFGLDAGLTYIIPLGNDYSLSPHVNAPLKQSLRFSIAVTDFGMVRYHNNPGQWNSRAVIRSYDELPQTAIRYDGKPGELYRFLYNDPGEQQLFDNLFESDDSPYFVQLPAELHLGSALQYNWFVSLLDLNYRFNPSNFEKKGWQASLGTEIRLLRYFPLQSSIQLNPDGIVSFGFGAGIDFGFIHTSAGVRVFHNNSNGRENAWHTDTISALGLQIRF